jgi:hypothetical protein
MSKLFEGRAGASSPVKVTGTGTSVRAALNFDDAGKLYLLYL